jgi:hypothetical protein
MDEYTIRQAIDLIKARRYSDARKLLKPVLEVSPTNEAAWIWFASTYSGPAEKIQVFRAGIKFCPGSEGMMHGIAKCEDDINELKAKGEEPEPLDIQDDLPHIAREVKRVEEPLKLPEPGEVFEWNSPLITPRKQVQLFPEEEPQLDVPSPTPTPMPFETQGPSWMDDLRGTMVVDKSEQPAESQVEPPRAAFGLFTKPAGETLEVTPPPVESIPGKLKNLWDRMGEEPEERAEKVEEGTLTHKLLGFWDKLVEAPQKIKEARAAAPAPAAPVKEQPPFEGFEQKPAEEEEEEIRHPEFFQKPAPEPPPEPIVEPVVVWGAQTADADQQAGRNPWDYTAPRPTAAPTPASAPAFIETPSAFASYGQPAEAKPAEAAGEEVHDPYQTPFNLAMALAIVLTIAVILIAVANFI